MEGFILPSLFQIGGYKVFFWSNENNEPIHVHIAKGKPTSNATKVWITSLGGGYVPEIGVFIDRSKVTGKDALRYLTKQERRPNIAAFEDIIVNVYLNI